MREMKFNIEEKLKMLFEYQWKRGNGNYLFNDNDHENKIATSRILLR